ncbi:peroxidase 5-like [Silene latifolia]|uniref:peroxidase 5-like n=1 Tax=Silene latifolia TaxID=37657 RepID=UPI003D77ED8C
MSSSKMQSHNSIALVVLLSIFSCLEAQLQVGFYSQTCPIAEAVVTQQVANAFLSNPGIAPGLVRMHFHDCFVRGCDASILIDSAWGNTAEKDSPVNNPSLIGFEVIDAAKSILETQCKGIVSCADILAFAARDSIALSFGPVYQVPSGRRDGRVSLASEVQSNIPSPAMNVDQLTTNFANKQLTQDEMVTLSGAHTIGVSHCSIITGIDDRLYNFSGTNMPDPALNPSYLPQLQAACPRGSTSTSSVVPMDPNTPMVLDNNYYANVLVNKGLFTSDWTLRTNPATAAAVNDNANNQAQWLNKFTAAVVKMGYIDVSTGTAGEIRTNCRVIN